MKDFSFITLMVSIFMIFGILAANIDAQKKIIWERGTDIPLPRGGYFAAWRDGGLWIAGGSYWKDGKKLWTNDSCIYDPKTRKWRGSDPIPKAIGYGVTANIDNELFILGGTDAEGSLNKDIFRFRDGKWRKVGESPAGFIFAAFATVGSNIYIFGGSTSPTDVTKATNTTWIYNTKNNEWKSSKPFPGEPRQIFSGAAVGKQIYIFGGVTQKPNEQFHNLDDAYKFDVKTERWKAIKKMPAAVRAFWAGSDGNSIYLIGGYSESGLDSVIRYSPKRDEYELISKLPQPLMDTKFIYNKGKFYGASGEDKLVSRFPGLVIGTVK